MPKAPREREKEAGGRSVRKWKKREIDFAKTGAKTFFD